MAITLGETMASRFSILYPDLHLYTVNLEEGATYTFEITDTLGRSSVSIFDAGSKALARNTDSDGNRAERIVWTAPKSDTYFLQVIGAYTNSYTLTVTGRGTTPSSAQGPTTTPGTSPASSTSGTALKFASVSAGGNHTCGVTTSGAAYCWGWDYNGQLGNGPATDDQPNPVAVSGGLTFAMVSAGSGHTCGVTTAGAAYCWGQGFSGQIGNGASDDRHTPTAVSGGLTFASVSAGNNHSCGITTSGAVNCWGEFRFPLSTSSTPVLAGINLASISNYHNHTCGVETGGAAYCWGLNWGGQLGIGTEDPQGKPVAVLGGLAFASVSTGETHTCGVTTSGDAYCWGLGDDRIGSDSINQRTMPVQTRPVPVSGGLKFESVSAGSGHTCGVTTVGVAYCWGAGNSGRLGDGLEKNSPRRWPLCRR